MIFTRKIRQLADQLEMKKIYEMAERYMGRTVAENCTACEDIERSTE